MSKGRLEAFSDGVLAIIITIMVLELKTPSGTDPASLRALAPTFLSYFLSFVFIGIYWTNHHHLLQAIKVVNGAALWANLHLLFWLSLVPFFTRWIGRTGFRDPVPVALYGAVLLFAALAYTILNRTLIALHGRNSTLARAVGGDFKGNLSLVLYVAAIPLAFLRPGWAYGLFGFVALMWLVPDRRIERILMK
jgi:TMEM175 potassium channel family protein